MQIYLVRHGIAESISSGSDADRDLTEEGRKKLRDVLKTAARAGVAPSLVISSPYRRAVATARIAIDLLDSNSDLVESRALVPDGDVRNVWQEVRTYRDQDSLMLVGHEPLFSSLGAYLLGFPDLAIDFKKGALLAIEVNSFGPHPRGILKWMLTARLANG
jgi:phosphohistidine phosphatase